MPQATKVASKLLKKYPDPKLALNFSNPLELLVAVILSAQCTDARANEVTKMLFKKYRSAKDYVRADLATFEQEIRPTGFYRNKAKSVIGCAKKLVDEFGGEVPRTVEEMVRLPGVGRKTANMVLGNALGNPGIAVDTHLLRVANRIGLVQSSDPEAVERELMRQLPRARWTAFSNAMILHGRETCTARKPKCPQCVVYDECEWPEKVTRSLKRSCC